MSLTHFLVTLLVFTVAVAGMAVGWLVARKPLAGTCGGLGNMKDRFGDPMCDLCKGDPSKKPDSCVRP